MALSLKTLVISALAILGALAPKAAAMAPLSNDVHTETAPAQEIGSMTADGFFVYSMNQCTIVQTTVCETMVSTGAPVPSYGPPPGSSLPYEGTEKTEYPLPTDQQSSSGNENASNTHSTEGGIETATSTGGEEEPSDTASATETEPTETDAPSSGYALPFNVVLAYAFTAMLLL